MRGQAARLLRIHIPEAARYRGEPLHEAVIGRCRALNIAGATVIRGLEGYGESAQMHRPVLILIVDTAANLARLIPVVEEMIDTGVMALSEVQALRIEKP